MSIVNDDSELYLVTNITDRFLFIFSLPRNAWSWYRILILIKRKSKIEIFANDQVIRWFLLFAYFMSIRILYIVKNRRFEIFSCTMNVILLSSRIPFPLHALIEHHSHKSKCPLGKQIIHCSIEVNVKFEHSKWRWVSTLPYWYMYNSLGIAVNAVICLNRLLLSWQDVKFLLICTWHLCYAIKLRIVNESTKDTFMSYQTQSFNLPVIKNCRKLRHV